MVKANLFFIRRISPTLALLLVLVFSALIYWPGLYGGWQFDDYPNIVENRAVQPAHADFPALVGAALSSPASEFKRPLASLSFAANYLAAGLDPFWMKLTNLAIHLLNGALVYGLAKLLIRYAQPAIGACAAEWTALLIAAGWLLLPINLTAVLYVVQRMESLANAFVLLGLIGYVRGRARMLAAAATGGHRWRTGWGGFVLAGFSVAGCTFLGLTAKETAVMLPLYALLVEWTLFGFRYRKQLADEQHVEIDRRIDGRIVAMFVFGLLLPLLAGLAWQLPGLLNAQTWVTRDFTLGTRLLSEARIVIGYIVWTLLPLPSSLSFYHDDYVVSSGLSTPWSTLPSLLLIVALTALARWLHKRQPLSALGIALFLGCHLLTGTILPLELIYEHRNYFASFGLLLAVLPPLLPAVWLTRQPYNDQQRMPASIALRLALLGALLLGWSGLTASTAYAWGEPLRLAQTLAERAPDSPRAQYELGRTYIIYSRNDPASRYTQLAYAPLERAAAMPESSILPQQALIFMNARMNQPLKDAWWNSLIAKLKARPTGVQDDSSLAVLTQCARDGSCDLPKDRMQAAFEAAINHPDPSARVLATYGDYAWSVLGDRELGLRMTQAAIAAAPSEPAYHITLIRMLIALHRVDDARAAIKPLQAINFGGRLDNDLSKLLIQLSIPPDFNKTTTRRGTVPTESAHSGSIRLQ